MSTAKVQGFWNEKWAQVITKGPTKFCDYFISNYGRIKSVNKETGEENLLKGTTTGGFKTVSIRIIKSKSKSHGIYIHKFVAEHFVKKKKKEDDSYKFVIHLDQDKKNNYWKNLKWVDRRGLVDFQIENGVYDHANRKMPAHAKMTETKVRLLKKRLREGKTKKKILAKSFKITPMQLNRIERGENWGHIE